MATLAELLSGEPEEEDIEALDLEQLLRQQDARRAKLQDRRAQLREVIAQNRYVRFAGVVATHTNRSVRATGAASLLKTWVRELLQEFDEEAPMAIQALLNESETARDAFAGRDTEELQDELEEFFDERALPPVSEEELVEPGEQEERPEEEEEVGLGARVSPEGPGARMPFDDEPSPPMTPTGGRSRAGSVTDPGSSPMFGGLGGSPIAESSARDFRDLQTFLAGDSDDEQPVARPSSAQSTGRSLPRRQQTRHNTASQFSGSVQRRPRPVPSASSSRRHILSGSNNTRSSSVSGVRSSARRPAMPLVMASANGRRRQRRHHDEHHADRLSEPQPAGIRGRGLAVRTAFALPRDQDVSDLFMRNTDGSWVWSERLAGAVFAALQRVKMRCAGPLRNAQHYNDILMGGNDEAYSLFARLVAAELTVAETMVPTHALLERAYSWNMENIERIVNALRFFSFSPTGNPKIAPLPRDTLQQAYEGHRMTPGAHVSEAHQAAVALRDMGFGGSLYNM